MISRAEKNEWRHRVVKVRMRLGSIKGSKVTHPESTGRRCETQSTDESLVIKLKN